MGREQLTNVKIAQAATLDHKPAWPNKLLFLAIGLVLATGGSLGAALAAESLDQTLRTTSQVEALLGLPVLLSFTNQKRRRRRPASASPESEAIAAGTNGAASGRNGHHQRGIYRELVGELLSTNGQGQRYAKAVGVVGCGAPKLRSRVAVELAIQAASVGGDAVLLIDADPRGRSVARRFHINGSPGWREVVAGVIAAESCIHRSKSGNLAVMPPGGSNGHALTTKVAMSGQGQLDEIKSEYSLVVVDLPLSGELGDPPVAAQWIDQMVLVVEAERTRIQAAQRAKSMLERRGIHLTGVVLANRREHVPRWLYQRL
jgi:tyrosine-protein kinase Etk/Wzc